MKRNFLVPVFSLGFLTVLSSAQVDAWVNRELTEGRPLYTLDGELLRALEPDVILTQQLCDVCAIDYGSVAAFASRTAIFAASFVLFQK